MTVLSPMLVAQSLALAERYLQDTRPVARQAEVVAVGPRAWFVLQSVMHGEKKLCEALDCLGVETYVPMARKEVKHRRSRRPVMRQFRLFNRFIFAFLPKDTSQWRTVRAIDEYDGVLGMGGVPSPVADADIARFRREEAARAFDITKTERFPVGSRVHVLSGPFGGFAGLVESLPGRDVVRAMLEIFGRSTAVDFPFDTVEPD